jgi:hypothetical protein
MRQKVILIYRGCNTCNIPKIMTAHPAKEKEKMAVKTILSIILISTLCKR